MNVGAASISRPVTFLADAHQAAVTGNIGREDDG